MLTLATGLTGSRSARRVPWGRARELAHDVPPLPAVELPLVSAEGHVLAEPVCARTDLPAFDSAAMDGWVVAGPGPWRLSGASLAGHPARRDLRPGEAMVVTTGAVVPGGCTGVVRSEQGTVDGGWLAPAAVRADVRPRATEAVAGEVLLAAGTVLQPPALGLAAAAGHDRLRVRSRPRVALLVLGDELLDRGPARHGRVRDALGVQLPGWIWALGGTVGSFRRVGDDPRATIDALRELTADHDVVLTTGGTARGDADHLRTGLAAVDARLVVDGVAVRPGSPMLLARSRSAWIVGLPGNPLAALAGVTTLVEPLLAGLRGLPAPAVHPAVLDGAPEPPAHGALLRPVTGSRRTVVRTVGFTGPAMLRGVAGADGFAVIAEGSAGDVDVCPFPWA